MPVREPAVAGQFYPANAEALRACIAECLATAQVSPAPERVAGIVVPHAGYPYSGAVAAHAFKRIQGKQPSRVVLLGRSHHYGFDGAAILDEGSFATPLGALPIDAALADQLKPIAGGAPSRAHMPEHALEVEVPFLQEVLGEVPILPILFGAEPSEWHENFGRELAALLDPEDLVLVSTDLSHFLDNDDAHAIDRRTVDGILEQDAPAVASGILDESYSMCGATAVVAGMACALERGASDWRLLDYRTSGDVAGMLERVVGYAALTMEYPV